MPLCIEQLRGGLVETVHPVSAALSDGERTVWSIGDDVGSFWRSGSKPMQLVSSLEALGDSDLPEEDLAIGAASHSGQPFHVARVQALLARFGLDVSGLRCGAHWPVHEPSARELSACTPLHSNCSGKHTFMLAAAAAQGWDPDYLPLAHPLQQRNHARIEEWCGTRAATAVDGCGVPTFFVPVRAMARAFARLAHEMGDGTAASLSGAGRIGWAMYRHPQLVSGEGRLDLAVTRGAAEPLTCKIGAEGLFCIALPTRRQGLVIKVATGNTDAVAVAVKAVLAEVTPGVLPAAGWPWETVANVVGRPVGERRAVWS